MISFTSFRLKLSIRTIVFTLTQLKQSFDIITLVCEWTENRNLKTWHYKKANKDMIVHV